MLTSARMMSGFACRAAARAASPSSTVVSFTSARAKVILTACWMVLESSARSKFLGMAGYTSTTCRQQRQVWRGVRRSIIQVVAAAVITHSAHATHPAHSTHSATAAAGRHLGLLLRLFGDHGLGGEEQARHGRGVLQRGAGDLGG